MERDESGTIRRRTGRAGGTEGGMSNGDVLRVRADLDLLASYNTDFHSLVVDLSGNDYLGLLVAPMARRVQWVFRTSAATRAPHSWTEHEELLKAIASGDEDYAEAVARSHVAAARASYRNVSTRPDVLG